MQTWKSKYNELLESTLKARAWIETQDKIINACLISGAKLLFTCEGPYGNEFGLDKQWVYEVAGKIIIGVPNERTHHIYDSIEDALTLYRKLSNRRCNLAIIEGLEAYLKQAA